MLKKLKDWWGYRHYWKLSRMWQDFKYWLRCNTYNRYHILNMSNKQNDWDWGWKDVDHQILYATMALMVKHVEKELEWSKELLEGGVDYPFTERLKPIEEQELYMLDYELDKAELLSIYRWWKYERSADHKLHDEALDEHCTKYPIKRVVEKVTPEGTLYKWADERSEEQNAEMTAIFQWEEDLYQKDTDMIQRLIAIRPRLWT